MDQAQEQLHSLLAPLQRLDALELGRPSHMTLANYLQRLVMQRLLSPESASLFLEAYHSLRFQRQSLDDELLQRAAGVLQQCAEKAETASLEERQGWEDALQPPEDEEETTQASSAEEDVDESVQETEKVSKSKQKDTNTSKASSPKSTPVGAAKEAAVSSTPQERPAATQEPSKPRRRRFVTDAVTEEQKERGVRAFFRRSLLSHLWWIVLLGIVGGLFVFWQGVKNANRAQVIRYKLRNRFARWMGFHEHTIPSRYLPYHQRPRVQRRRAVRRFTRFIVSRKPNNPDLWYRLAEYHYERDHYAKAAAFYARVISLRPNHPAAYNDLAWLLCTADDREYRDPIRALPLAAKAYALRPKSSDVVDTYALTLFQNKQFRRAAEIQSEAVALSPKDSDYRRRLRRYKAAYKFWLKKNGKSERPTSKPTP
ncbi:MAG: tetratricopeptide repeat protein [Deltaproteobacteria bacterium]|nr:MAG: tetratricopeptide repeat protein [Deltaproteobacteria bacterium]